MQSSSTSHKPGSVASIQKTTAPDTHDDWEVFKFSDWFEDPTISEDSEDFHILTSCTVSNAHTALIVADRVDSRQERWKPCCIRQSRDLDFQVPREGSVRVTYSQLACIVRRRRSDCQR